MLEVPASNTNMPAKKTAQVGPTKVNAAKKFDNDARSATSRANLSKDTRDKQIETLKKMPGSQLSGAAKGALQGIKNSDKARKLHQKDASAARDSAQKYDPRAPLDNRKRK